MTLKKTLFTILFGSLTIAGIHSANAQVTGGQRAFEYLRLSNSPHVSALGGIAPANSENDVSLSLQNPALMRPEMHNQLALSTNIYYAGIGIGNLQYAYHIPSLKTDFGLGIQYVNYGTFAAKDIYGMDLGNVHASDYSINLSASRSYKEKWRYGVTLKWANSFLGDRSAAAALSDVGIAYFDKERLLTIGIVAKNIGITLSKYNKGNLPEPLPFDLQLGITKQLENVPVRLFLVGHHLYEWNIRYDNPADKVKNRFATEPEVTDKKYFVDKLFRHILVGGEIIIGKRITATVSYNHLHRSELAATDAKGAAGFGFGGMVNLNRIQVRYARTFIGSSGAYNEFGFNFQLNKLFSVGKKTEPWGWDKTYE